MSNPASEPSRRVRVTSDRELDEALRIIRAVAREVGLDPRDGQSAGIINFNFYFGEATMDQQKSQSGNTTNIKVGNVTRSSIGSIGVARDIDAFNNLIDASQQLDEELK